jgi:RNA polymerase sigma factor (sigma-70 family)
LDALGDSLCTADAFYEDTVDPGPESRYFAKEASQRLREEIQRLPPQMCNCVLLRVYQELKYREIGVVLRISIDTVKSHLYQAKDRLRVHLGEYVDTINLEEGEDDG